MESLRRGRRLARFAAGVLALALATGCGLTGDDANEPGVGVAVADPVAGAPSPSAEPAPSPEALRLAPSKTAEPKKKPSRKPTKKASTRPTKEPIWDQAPECSTFEGKAVPKAKAKAALTAAAGRVYWQTSAPKLKVPLRLVKAISWQESGWQSNIVNCDGGFGLMQAMPDTVAFVNQRFGLSYDVRNYRDNAFIGANYLAWLTKKFGDNYFKGNYNLSASECKSHSDLCLLNMVISAYNAGDGSVEQSRASKQLPNPAYVDSVRSLMRDCDCDRF